MLRVAAGAHVAASDRCHVVMFVACTLPLISPGAFSATAARSLPASRWRSLRSFAGAVEMIRQLCQMMPWPCNYLVAE